MNEHQTDLTWIGGVLAALWAALLALIGTVYTSMREQIKLLAQRQDEIERDAPREYVRIEQCDRNHARLTAEIERALKQIIDEQRHQRRLLERHLRLNGGLPEEDAQ